MECKCCGTGGTGEGWGDGWRRVGGGSGKGTEEGEEDCVEEGGEGVERWVEEGGEEGKGIDNKNSSIHLHYFYIGVIFSNKINNLS